MTSDEKKIAIATEAAKLVAEAIRAAPTAFGGGGHDAVGPRIAKTFNEVYTAIKGATV